MYRGPWTPRAIFVFASLTLGLGLSLFEFHSSHKIEIKLFSSAFAQSNSRSQSPSPKRNMVWHARRLPTEIVMAGLVWEDADLADRVTELRQGLEVRSWTNVSELIGEDSAKAQLAALSALVTFKSGYVEIRGQRLIVSGVVTSTDAELTREQIRTKLPAGYTIARFDVLPPAKEPYSWSAYADGQQVELNGFVPNEEVRHQLIATAGQSGDAIRVVDRLRIRADAPRGFDIAARAALLQLSQFNSGVVSLTGNRFDLFGRAPRVVWTESGVCRQTLAFMPKAYSCGFVYIDSRAIKKAKKAKKKADGGGGGGSGPASDASRPTKPFRSINPAKTPVADLGIKDKDPRIVDLYFATNRKPDDSASEEKLTGERGDSLLFGLVRVRVPNDHKIGRLELPGGLSIFGWQLTEETLDPKVHFLIRNRQILSREDWDSFLRELKPTDALVFVHGFNTSFDEAAFRMAQVVWDLQYRGLPVLFSWPSRGGVLNYPYDRESALGARDHFIDLLQILRNKHRIEKVHVISHSMGNFVVLDALASHARTSDPVRIGELIMAAPDIDRDQFLRQIPEVRKITKGLTLYASSADKALVASRSFAGGIPRAGDVPAGGPIVLPGLDTIDVTALGEEMFGLNHAVFAAARSLIDDIGILVRDNHRAPRLPQIRPVPEGALTPTTFWRYVH